MDDKCEKVLSLAIVSEQCKSNSQEQENMSTEVSAGSKNNEEAAQKEGSPLLEAGPTQDIQTGEKVANEDEKEKQKVSENILHVVPEGDPEKKEQTVANLLYGLFSQNIVKAGDEQLDAQSIMEVYPISTQIHVNTVEDSTVKVVPAMKCIEDSTEKDVPEVKEHALLDVLADILSNKEKAAEKKLGEQDMKEAGTDNSVIQAVDKPSVDEVYIVNEQRPDVAQSKEDEKQELACKATDKHAEDEVKVGALPLSFIKQKILAACGLPADYQPPDYQPPSTVQSQENDDDDVIVIENTASVSCPGCLELTKKNKELQKKLDVAGHNLKVLMELQKKLDAAEQNLRELKNVKPSKSVVPGQNAPTKLPPLKSANPPKEKRARGSNDQVGNANHVPITRAPPGGAFGNYVNPARASPSPSFSSAVSSSVSSFISPLTHPVMSAWDDRRGDTPIPPMKKGKLSNFGYDPPQFATSTSHNNNYNAALNQGTGPMPGVWNNSSASLSSPFPSPASVASSTFAWPNAPAFSGFSAPFQGSPLPPSFNGFSAPFQSSPIPPVWQHQK